MNLENLKTILSELNIPLAYSHFNKVVDPPFLTYRIDHTENFFAENKTYKKIPVTYIELYTKNKNIKLEEKLEEILNNNDIAWEIEAEDYIESEKVYQIIYRI